MTQRNEDVLRRVADRIETTPEQYDQWEWFVLPDGDVPLPGEHLAEGCGTVACIAGWAVHETAGEAPQGFWEAAGAEALGITLREAKVLFHEDWLPAGWTPEDTHAMIGKRAAEALRRLADGASLRDVTETLDRNSDVEWRLVVAEGRPGSWAGPG